MVRVRLSGDAYNRKTLNRVKKSLPKPQVGVGVGVVVAGAGGVQRGSGRCKDFKFKTSFTKEDLVVFNLT